MVRISHAFRLRREHQAGIDGLAIHQDRAGAALARLAAALHAEITLAAQHVQQQVAGRDGPLLRFAVHREPQFHGLHNAHPAACRAFLERPPRQHPAHLPAVFRRCAHVA